MDSKIAPYDTIEAQVVRSAGLFEDFKPPRTVWKVECYGRDGQLKWEDGFLNLVTDEGCTDVLKRYFATSAQVNSWYVFPYESNTTPAAGDTYASTGHTECSAYNEVNRQRYMPAAPAAKSTDNSASKAEFTMNASKTIYGFCLVGGGTSAETKNNTGGGGVLFCAGRLGSSRAVVATDVVRCTITIGTQDV